LVPSKALILTVYLYDLIHLHNFCYRHQEELHKALNGSPSLIDPSLKYSISVIDSTDNKVVDNIPTVNNDFGNLPLIYNLATYLAVNPRTNTVYLTDEDTDTVNVNHHGIRT
jgi:hypothetical protein